MIKKHYTILLKKQLVNKSLLKLFAKISLQEQKEIMKNQRSTFHKLKSLNIENYDSDIFTLASLLVAIADFTKNNE